MFGECLDSLGICLRHSTRGSKNALLEVEISLNKWSLAKVCSFATYPDDPKCPDTY